MTETRILVASSNRGKVAEIRAALAGLPIILLTLDDLAIRVRAPETGTSFMENARVKSLFYSRRADVLTLAEDSGLEVESLGGAPGVHSARFAGPGATDEKNIRKLLRSMRDMPRAKRRAAFVCCMVLSRKNRLLMEITGRVRGSIALEKMGTRGFGYDPVFWYPPLHKSFGELAAGDKNKISHRGRALKKLAGRLASHPEVWTEP